MSPWMRSRRLENVIPSSSTLTELAPTVTDVLADAPGAVTRKALAVSVAGSSTLYSRLSIANGIGTPPRPRTPCPVALEMGV